MRTRRLPATPDGIAEAAALLRAGRLVAFGTETVYGLGARADDDAAVAAIYAAKGRPSFNPLICHYPAASDARADVLFDARADIVAASFWPGSLTLVLPRRATGRPCGRVAAGLSSLAIRVPRHATAASLLQAAAVPVAAPSANLSGRVSPTTADHVLDGLSGRIDAVLDCGPCRLGLESTILDLSGERLSLLRHGAVTPSRIEAALGPLSPPPPGIYAPGQLAAHYAPGLPLRLDASAVGTDEALLAYGCPLSGAALVYQLSEHRRPAQAAARLFAGLRWLDAHGAANRLRGIAAMTIPQIGVGAAINDRLSRAASRGEGSPGLDP